MYLNTKRLEVWIWNGSVLKFWGLAIVPNILKLNQYIGIQDGSLFGYICNGLAVWIYNGICEPNHSTSELLRSFANT